LSLTRDIQTNPVKLFVDAIETGSGLLPRLAERILEQAHSAVEVLDVGHDIPDLAAGGGIIKALEHDLHLAVDLYEKDPGSVAAVLRSLRAARLRRCRARRHGDLRSNRVAARQATTGVWRVKGCVG
jgi:hypothetical protein